MPEQFMSVDKKEYAQLIEDQKTLNALYAGGVDDWEWYEESLDAARKELDDA